MSATNCPFNCGKGIDECGICLKFFGGFPDTLYEDSIEVNEEYETEDVIVFPVTLVPSMG